MKKYSISNVHLWFLIVRNSEVVKYLSRCKPSLLVSHEIGNQVFVINEITRYQLKFGPSLIWNVTKRTQAVVSVWWRSSKNERHLFLTKVSYLFSNFTPLKFSLSMYFCWIAQFRKLSVLFKPNLLSLGAIIISELNRTQLNLLGQNYIVHKSYT